VVERLLGAAITDAAVSVRRQVLRALERNSALDPLLAQADWCASSLLAGPLLLPCAPNSVRGFKLAAYAVCWYVLGPRRAPTHCTTAKSQMCAGLATQCMILYIHLQLLNKLQGCTLAWGLDRRGPMARR
jgi:hypothetical protein